MVNYSALLIGINAEKYDHPVEQHAGIVGMYGEWTLHDNHPRIDEGDCRVPENLSANLELVEG